MQREHGGVALVDAGSIVSVPAGEGHEGRAVELAREDHHLGALDPHRSRAALEASVQEARPLVVTEHLWGGFVGWGGVGDFIHFSSNRLEGL